MLLHLQISQSVKFLLVRKNTDQRLEESRKFTEDQRIQAQSNTIEGLHEVLKQKCDLISKQRERLAKEREVIKQGVKQPLGEHGTEAGKFCDEFQAMIKNLEGQNQIYRHEQSNQARQ